MRLCSPEQPYPGLRPFEPQEAEYFCGRKREIHRLESMIREQRLVAVLGSSGAGKSSLVLAGVLPRLTQERLSSGESAWQALRMRPGGAPFRALAEKAAELACSLHPEQAVSSMVLRDRALGLLRRSSQGLQQVAVELGLTSGVHLLLIVDQFEELFRYKGIDRRQARRGNEEPRDQRDEAAAFAAELLAAREDGAQPVHVVITMRSDFIGEAARFLGLPEAIDAGQFLVPRMSRAQMEAAIREPLGLAGVTISPGLVQRLLNDTGTEPDALPVIQHVLLRTWEQARAEATAPAPGQDREISAPDTSGRKLLPRHYEAVGTMAHALSQHANAILDQLGKEDRELPEVARWLFRALSEVDKEGRAARRPQRYAELVALMGSRRRKQVRPLTGGDVRNATVFYIVKAGGSSETQIHFGDSVKIRGVNGDPWLHVPTGGGPVVGGPPENASIFVVEHPSDSSAGNVIKIGDQFKIRGTDGDPWLHVPPSGGQVVGGSPPDASVFVVKDMNVPGKISEALEVTSPRSGPVQLGWTKIVPCSKVKGFKLKLAEQRIYAYADISLRKISDAARSSVKDCAAVGVGACGLNSILTTPGTCVPTFAGAFGSCMTSKAPEVAVEGVNLFTQTKCLW